METEKIKTDVEGGTKQRIDENIDGDN